MQKEAILATPWSEVSWQKVLEDVEKLSLKFQVTPDIIVAIARGGNVPAALLGKHLSVADSFSLKVKKEGEQRVLLYDIVSPLRGKKILVVDDMIETGEGLRLVKRYLESQGAMVMTACLYVLSTSSFRPDYYIQEVEEVQVFPWD